MAIIERRRTLRPSTREVTSTYKVDTKKVTLNDTLIVRIDHEDNPGKVLYEYKFSGKKLNNKNSIHFSAKDTGKNWEIIWSKIQPN